MKHYIIDLMLLGLFGLKGHHKGNDSIEYVKPVVIENNNDSLINAQAVKAADNVPKLEEVVTELKKRNQ